MHMHNSAVQSPPGRTTSHESKDEATIYNGNSPNMGDPSDDFDLASNILYKRLLTYGVRNINEVNSALIATGLENGRDFEKLERARRLSSSEYSFNSQLGYISLNQSLNNDEVLAVAFQYTIGNKTFQVGELSTTGPTAPDALILKLLKGTNFTPSLPNWDLMMKNIYSIGAYQMSRDGFVLDVVYENTEETGAITNYLTVPTDSFINGRPLIRLLNLDRLNQQTDVQSDGIFDFIEILFNKNLVSKLSLASIITFDFFASLISSFSDNFLLIE